MTARSVAARTAHPVRVRASERTVLTLYCILLVLAAGAFVRWDTAAHPNWSNDGYTYLLRTQTDAGIPYARARSAARAWYADKPPMSDPRFIESYNAPQPEYWRLFAPRVLYPWLASRLYPSEGVQSLLTVSNAAYVLALVAIFFLLALYVRPEGALLLTIACALFPEMRLLARAPLTDMLALALWCWTLLALCRCARERSAVWLGIYAAAALLMTLARPIPYVPLCAAIALFLWARQKKAPAQMKAALAAGSFALALCALDAAMAAAAGAPSLGWTLQHIRAGSRLVTHAPLAVWYGVRVAATSAATVAALLSLLAPVAAAVRLWYARARPETAIYAGAAASTALTILSNPIPSDIPRVVVLPLLPIIAAGLAVTFAPKTP